MSGEDQKPSDKSKSVEPAVRRSIASRFTETTDLPDDLKVKIKEMASSLGKSETEVYQELVVKGLASTSEDVAYLMVRKKVIDSLTRSERIQVLKNEAEYMKAVHSVFETWRETPTPITTQPATSSTQPTVSQPSTQPTSVQGRPYLIPAEQVDKATEELLRQAGLPTNVTTTQPSQETQGASHSSAVLVSLAKYAIDRLGATAVSSLLTNPKIQEAVAGIITKIGTDPRLQEILGGVLGDLDKLMRGGGQPPP